jgi:hypothetical protein
MNMAFPTVGCDVHTAGRLVVDDGPPMDMPIFCCHFLPPNDEDFSLPRSITQIRTAGKTGASGGYLRPQKPGPKKKIAIIKYTVPGTEKTVTVEIIRMTRPFRCQSKTPLVSKLQFTRGMSNISRHTTMNCVISLPHIHDVTGKRNDGRTAKQDHGRGV